MHELLVVFLPVYILITRYFLMNIFLIHDTSFRAPLVNTREPIGHGQLGNLSNSSVVNLLIYSYFLIISINALLYF